MIIMQGRKNFWYIVKLCFKLTFSFEKTLVSFTCYPLSYTSILNTSNIVFLGNKLVYTRSNDNIAQYTINDFYVTLFDIHEEFKWLYLRERRKFSYNNLQYGPFINEFYFFIFRKIYSNYKIFYNSFFIKAHYGKNYSGYRSSYLIEYLWKFHFSYENTYFPTIFNEHQLKFNLQNEFFKNDIIFKNESYQNYSIEFFCFRRRFFHNPFYNFFYRTNSYVFTDNFDLPIATNNDILHNKFFYDYLGISVNNKFNKDIILPSSVAYSDILLYIQAYYKVLIYLFIK